MSQRCARRRTRARCAMYYRVPALAEHAAEPPAFPATFHVPRSKTRETSEERCAQAAPWRRARCADAYACGAGGATVCASATRRCCLPAAMRCEWCAENADAAKRTNLPIDARGKQMMRVPRQVRCARARILPCRMPRCAVQCVRRSECGRRGSDAQWRFE